MYLRFLHGLEKGLEAIAFQTKVMFEQHQSLYSFRLQPGTPHRDGISSAGENTFDDNSRAWQNSGAAIWTC
jgi:hypothetical protein